LRAISHELNIRVKAFLKKSLSAQHGFEGSEYAADDIGNDKAFSSHLMKAVVLSGYSLWGLQRLPRKWSYCEYFIEMMVDKLNSINDALYQLQ